MSLDALTEHMSVQAEDRVVIDPAVWEAMARAIERQDILRADYRRFDGKSGSYEIEPLHLLAYHGNWYVLARSRGSDKTFALSRFGKVAPTGKHFKRPAEFDWRAFSREESANIGETVTIEVQVANTGARPGSTVMQCYLRDEFPAVSLPRLCLAGWSRFEAALGETVIDRITIAARAFVYHDASGSERADPGAFILFTCPHSGDLTAAGLRIYAGNP